MSTTLNRDVVENGGCIYVGGLKPSIYIVPFSRAAEPSLPSL